MDGPMGEWHAGWGWVKKKKIISIFQDGWEASRVRGAAPLGKIYALSLRMSESFR